MNGRSSTSGRGASSPDTCTKTSGGQPGRGAAIESPTRATQELSDSFPFATREASLPRGHSVGRYIISDVLGAGGMGVVYRAFDPQLNRAVALKVLPPRLAGAGSASQASARLEREAQALAQLAHPNVVAVHDVGRADGDLFVAMELVEGVTLAQWRKAEGRAQHEILDVFIAAGTGLAAAHRAGLVHRDFKPGNVLVGDDGRVRVVDFGLARASADGDGSSDPVTGPTLLAEGTLDPDVLSTGPELAAGDEAKSLPSLRSEGSIGDTVAASAPITCVGAVLGTPRYMAPEQAVGGGVGAAADQFGFCVALYEALYDEHPFYGKGRTPPSYRRSFDVLPPPSGTRVPAWLRKVLLRGMQVAVERRFPTMDDLIAALRADPAARRRRVVAVGALAAVLAAGVGSAMAMAPAGPSCAGAERWLEGVWDGETRQAIKASWDASSLPYAAETLGQIERSLDEYASEWAALHTRTCEATHVHGVQSEALLDLRIGCLTRTNHRVASLTEWLRTTPDEPMLRKAVTATAAAAELAECEDDVALRATESYPMPTDVEVRKRIAAAERRVDRLEVFLETGRYREGAEEAHELAAEVDELGYAPVQTEVHLLLGKLLAHLGDHEAADDAFARGVQFAAEAGDAYREAILMAKRIWAIGYASGRPAEASILVPHAKAALIRAGDSLRLQIDLQRAFGALAMANNDLTRARGYFERELTLYDERVGDDDPRRAIRAYNLGLVLIQQGEFEGAYRHLERALAGWAAVLGPSHPNVGKAAVGLGEASLKQGKITEAVAHWRRALAIFDKRLPEGHFLRGITLHNLGAAFNKQEQWARATPYHRRALSIFEESVGSDHEYTGVALTALGEAQASLGQSTAALESLERSVTILEASGSTQLPEAHFALAKILWGDKASRARSLELARAAQSAWSAREPVPDEAATVADWLRDRAGELSP